MTKPTVITTIISVFPSSVLAYFCTFLPLAVTSIAAINSSSTPPAFLLSPFLEENAMKWSKPENKTLFVLVDSFVLVSLHVSGFWFLFSFFFFYSLLQHLLRAFPRAFFTFPAAAVAGFSLGECTLWDLRCPLLLPLPLFFVIFAQGSGRVPPQLNPTARVLWLMTASLNAWMPECPNVWMPQCLNVSMSKWLNGWRRGRANKCSSDEARAHKICANFCKACTKNKSRIWIK